ncbi:hypothetical protein LOTGIDRAFT_139105, partial [Lottia gigantea]
RTALHYAAANVHQQCVNLLLNADSVVNMTDIKGCTPLHYAAPFDSDARVVELLLRHDARPGIKDDDGFNAVHYAALKGHKLALEMVNII